VELYLYSPIYLHGFHNGTLCIFTYNNAIEISFVYFSLTWQLKSAEANYNRSTTTQIRHKQRINTRQNNKKRANNIVLSNTGSAKNKSLEDFTVN
jgi:hypothetical protein